MQDFEPSPIKLSTSEYFSVIIVTVGTESIRAECKSVSAHKRQDAAVLTKITQLLGLYTFQIFKQGTATR